MKKYAKKLLCVILVLIMTVTILSSCGKKPGEETDTPAAESNAESQETKNEIQNTQYKETFYMSEDRYGSWYSMKLTDTTAYLEWGNEPDGYSEGRIFTECPYYIDEDGNYVVDIVSMNVEYLYFGVSSGKIMGEECESRPLVFEKKADCVYVADDFVVMKMGQTTEKFIWLGPYGDEYFEQNSQVPEQMDFYYVDGKTGNAQYLTVGMDQVVMPDLSKVGDATIQITHDGKVHNVACYIYPEGESQPYHSYEDKYDYLEKQQNSTADYVTQGMTYQEYFATYTGEDPLFYYEVKNEETQEWDKIPVTDYTVEFWDSSLESGSTMVYRVSYEHEGVTYRYVDNVKVVAQSDLEKGSIRLSKVKQKATDISGLPGLGALVNGVELNRIDGVLYLAKGTDIATLELTCDITSYEGEEIKNAPVSAIGYDANTIGIQMVSLTSEHAIGETKLPVYVYDPANPILVKVAFNDNPVYDTNGVDYTQNKVIYTYCDNSTREFVLNDIRDQLTDTTKIENGGITINIKHQVDVVVDGKTYTLTGSMWRSTEKPIP